jgi:chromate reductase
LQISRITGNRKMTGARLFIGLIGRRQQRRDLTPAFGASRYPATQARREGCLMAKVAVIVGSIRKDSINKKLASALERLGAGRLEFERVRIDDLPLFNQDNQASTAPEVVRLKRQIAAANAVLFVTPEHNRSIPAALKNAIDTASRPPAESAFKGKWAAAITGTSRGRISTAVAQSHLRTILSGHFDVVLVRPEAYVQFTDGLIDDEGNVADEKTKEFLQNFIDRFADVVAAMPAR